GIRDVPLQPAGARSHEQDPEEPYALRVADGLELRAGTVALPYPATFRPVAAFRHPADKLWPFRGRRHDSRPLNSAISLGRRDRRGLGTVAAACSRRGRAMRSLRCDWPGFSLI